MRAADQKCPSNGLGGFFPKLEADERTQRLSHCDGAWLKAASTEGHNVALMDNMRRRGARKMLDRQFSSTVTLFVTVRTALPL